MKEKGLITDFTSGNIWKQLITFSMPLFFANLLQMVYNMVDMIVVGHVIGNVGISGVTIGGDISHFFTMLVMGFSAAASIIISQFVGAGQKEKVGKVIGTLSLFLLICAVVFTTGGLLLRHQLLDLMNAPAASYQEALAYCTTTIAGMIFIFGYNAVSAILRGLGDSKHPFIFIATAAIINIILDLLFVMVLHMGTFGAALATVIGQGVSFIWALIFLVKRKDSLGFDISKNDFKIDKDVFSIMVKLGIPMAIKSASISFSKLFINSFVNNYGVIVSAVAGVGNKICSVPMLVSNSVNTAGSSMIGQNIGGAKYDRVPKIMLAILTICGTITGLCIVIVLLFPSQVFMIFTSDESILPVAMEYLPILIINFVAAIVRAPTGSFINGSGNYKINFILAILDAFVARVGLGLLFGVVFKMEYFGFWLGDAISGTMPLFIGGGFLLSGKWKTRKYIVQEDE